LGETGIPGRRVRQEGHHDAAATVLVVAHKATRAALDEGVEKFDATNVVAGTPVAIRIEEV